MVSVAQRASRHGKPGLQESIGTNETGSDGAIPFGVVAIAQ